MTTDYRALCAELVELSAPVDSISRLAWRLQQLDRLANRARALLDQPVPEGPTDEELDELFTEIDQSGEALSWRLYARAALARWGRPTPQPEGGDIHYAWELHDAEGDWQAGGSANSLEGVQREGNRYLQSYSQDGPHKLIIQRHCVNTIEEATNG